MALFLVPPPPQMIHRETNTVYGEVDAMQTLLGYPVANAGCCKVVLHPQWGSSVYPATMFADAPLDALLRVIEEVDEERRKS